MKYKIGRKKGYTFKGNNLVLEEQSFFLQELAPLRRLAKLKMAEFLPLSVHPIQSPLGQWRHIQESPGRVAQSVGHLSRKSVVLGSIPGLATYFRFSFRIFKKGSCQLLAKVCARSTG